MTLKTDAARRGVLMAAGMRNWSVFSTTPGLQTITETHFNALMPGNAFKWVNTEPTQNTFSFTEADLFVNWANARSMYQRCHTLIWHTSLAPWVAGTLNSGNWQSIVNAHIAGVLGHYPGKVWDIDVVNEAFSLGDSQPGGYRNTLFYQAAGGSSYIPYAFDRARVASANGRLYLAEFGIEQSTGDAKRAALLTAVEDWLSQGTPIDGIAIQGHITANVSLDKTELRQFIETLKGMGLRVILSEFDFRNVAALGLSDAQAFAFIGSYAKEFLTTAFNAGAETVVAWGVSPDDWSATGSEQIASVPFTASPTFATTSIYDALISAFQVTGETSNLRVGHLNRVDPPGTLSLVSSAQPQLPGTHLQTSDIRELWRATSGNASIVVDFGQTLTIHLVMLLRTNLAGSDTIRVRLSAIDPDVFASLSYDSGVLTPNINTVYRKFVHFIEPGTPARYLRLTFAQSNIVEAGRLIAMRLWTPTKSMQYGWETTWRDPSRRTQSLGQATFIDEREAQRGLKLKFTGLRPEEGRDEMGEINRQKGTHRDIVVCLNRFSTELGEDTFWGLLEKPIEYPMPRPLSIDGDLEMWERL